MKMKVSKYLVKNIAKLMKCYKSLEKIQKQEKMLIQLQKYKNNQLLKTHNILIMKMNIKINLI